jgi:hypothetical protein
MFQILMAVKIHVIFGELSFLDVVWEVATNISDECTASVIRVAVYFRASSTSVLTLPRPPLIRVESLLFPGVIVLIGPIAVLSPCPCSCI